MQTHSGFSGLDLFARIVHWTANIPKVLLDDAGNTEQVRRIYLLFFISSIGIVTLISLGLLALKQGNCSLGSLDLRLAFLLIGNLIHVRIYKRYETNIHFGIFFTSIFFVYALLTGGISNAGFVWYYPFPLIASFLLGSKTGAVATGLIFFVALLFFAFFDTPRPTSRAAASIARSGSFRPFWSFSPFPSSSNTPARKTWKN